MMRWLLVCGIALFVIFWFFSLKKKKDRVDDFSNTKLQPSKIPKQQKDELISNYQNSLRNKQSYLESTDLSEKYYRDLILKLITSNTVILDTETTGLDEKAEIVEISIIDLKGNVLLDTLIKPKRKIPVDVIKIHGITNEMVSNAPTWEDIYKDFRKIVKSADLVLIYNERYDKRLIRQTCKLAKVPSPIFKSECVMKLMAQWNGEKKKNGEYYFKSLEFIAKSRYVKIEGTMHRSLTDCKTVLSIINSFINNQNQAVNS